MPYIFIDDGYPESAEFDNNYVWFNSADPKSIAALEHAVPAGHNALIRAAELAAPREREKKSSNDWKFWRQKFQ